jgi:UDP-glucose 4-epimerase
MDGTTQDKLTILVTGGLGYIGSHTVLELLTIGHKVIIIDDLSNSDKSVCETLAKLTQQEPQFHQFDIGDRDKLISLFSQDRIDAVIHFAAFKAVGESTTKPLAYYHNNVAKSIVLFEVMQQFGVNNIVFSSSATVYGEPKSSPVSEDFPLNPANTYGFTKLTVEQILINWKIANPELNIGILRYFNPVGAHKSGLLGENPRGMPNNLMPYICKVAKGELKELQVFGDDYPTKDGSGVRDYIHVVDLALGHIQAIGYMVKREGCKLILNLGTGIGYSVFEVIKTFEQAAGISIPYKVVARRAGDVPLYYANPQLAKDVLGWQTKFNLYDMCSHSWNYIYSSSLNFGLCRTL